MSGAVTREAAVLATFCLAWPTDCDAVNVPCPKHLAQADAILALLAQAGHEPGDTVLFEELRLADTEIAVLWAVLQEHQIVSADKSAPRQAERGVLLAQASDYREFYDHLRTEHARLEAEAVRLNGVVEAARPLAQTVQELYDDPEGMTYENAYYQVLKRYKEWRALIEALRALDAASSAEGGA